MEKHRTRKHQAHKRVLVVAHEHRLFFAATAGGANTLTKLDTAVANEAAQFARQERCGSMRQAAAEYCRSARRALRSRLRHVRHVSAIAARTQPDVPTFLTPPWASDVDLIGRADAIHTVASGNAALLENAGVQPGLLDSLANGLDGFKQAKNALAASKTLYTESNARFDEAALEGDEAVVVLEGILETSADAPAGALVALRQAKLIGPRDTEGDAPAAQAEQPAAAEPGAR
ncbi:MAG TPA: hypothetical protein VEU08_00495 [Vicinamibacterales bacterium]|nr:hypothetical protein [Vicinamibacterales bacterium]